MAFTKVVGAGIHTLSNIASHNINSSGIITATKFVGPMEGDITAVDGTFTGNVTIGGTLTYEDVKNVDSVGIITARQGIQIPNDTYKFRSGTSLEMQVWHDGTTSLIKDIRDSGKVRIQADNFDIIDKDASTTVFSAAPGGINSPKIHTFGANINLNDSIIHTGDDNTKIRFPTADTISMETAGTQGVRLTSAQKLLVGNHTSSRSVGFSEHVIQTEGSGAGANGISIYATNSSAHAGHFTFGKSRNNSSVADNDFLGHMLWAAHDGTDVDNYAARITGRIDGTVGSNVTPGSLEFYTTPANSNSVGSSPRLVIDSGGNVLVGTTDNAIYNDSSGEGIVLRGGDCIDINRSGDSMVNLNRLGSDGPIMNFRRDGSVKASLGIRNSFFCIDVAGSEKLRVDTSGDVLFGTTDDTVYNNSSGEGVVIRNGDCIDIARNTDNQLFLNRQGNDGYHIAFIRDGSYKSFIATRSSAFCIDVNGSERFRITSDGKIGINESSPSQRLHVGGDVQIGFNTPNDGARQINFNVNRGSAGQTLANINWQWNSNYVAQIRGIAGSDTTNKDDAHLAFFTSAANNLVERVRIDSTGKVGINEAGNINGRLHVQHDALGENILYATRYNDQTNDKPILAVTEASMNGMTASGLVLGTHNRGIHIGPVFDGSATVNTGMATGIRILYTGNVGINEGAPIARLHVKNGESNAAGYAHDTVVVEDSDHAFLTFLTGTSGSSGINFGDAGDPQRGVIQYDQNNDYMRFITAAGERARIDSSGRLRVASTTESADPAFDDLIVGNHSGNRGISILSENGQNSTLGFAKSGALSDGYIQYYHHSTANNSWMRIKSSGDIYLNDGSTDQFVMKDGGNIGLGGESSPIALLTLNEGSKGSNTTFANAELIRLEGYDSTNSKHGIGFGRYNGGQNGYKPAAFIGAATGTWSNYTNCHLVFATRNSTNDDEPTERLRITNSGKIGINETSPYAELDIAASVEDSNGSLSQHGIRLHHVGAADEEVIPISAGFVSQQDRARAGIGFISKTVSSSGGMGGCVAFYTRNTADGHGLYRTDERMRITQDGKVVAGGNGTGYTERLQAHGGGSTGGECLSLNSKGGSNIATELRFYENGSGRFRMKTLQGNGGIKFDDWLNNATRAEIAGDGDFKIWPGTRGWSTIQHRYNSRAVRRHFREFNSGSSATTHNLIRVRRHYWGWGHYKFTVKRVYYSGIMDSVFYLNGHGRDDGSYNPSYSITEYQHNGHGSNVQSSGRITITSPSGSSPGDVYANYVDVQLQCPAYMYLFVEVEAAASGYSLDTSSISSDAYALFN